MNGQHLNRNDTQHTFLWFIIRSARAHHEVLRRIQVGIPDQLRKHEKQVNDLYQELKRILENYHQWTSGKDLVPTLVNIVIDVEEYRSEIWDKPPNRPQVRAQLLRNSIVKRFRDRVEKFQEILDSLRELYRENQAQ